MVEIADDVRDRLVDLVSHAYERAPAVRSLFDRAGIRPSDIRGPADLLRLPVTSKDRLLELQRRQPPFGGYLGVDMRDVRRIFVSPGPIYEPDAGLRPGHGFDASVAAAGIGPDDVVLNTWSYHLVPGGLVFDEAFGRVGATVVPGGVGNSELLAQIIIDLGVTVIASSTTFFQTLVDRLVASGHRLPEDWKLRAAFLGGEFGDWSAKRRSLEASLHIRTHSMYGTADMGVIGYECRQQDGYHVVPDIIVQICDPRTGAAVAEGKPGEIVATSLDPSWPLVRFGTGDASMFLPGACPCGDRAPKLAPLLGRTGQAIKVREIFVYPRHIDEVRTRVAGVAKVQGAVERRDGRDEVDLLVEVENGADWDAVERAVRDAFTAVTRLRVGDVRSALPGTIDADESLLKNLRDL